MATSAMQAVAGVVLECSGREDRKSKPLIAQQGVDGEEARVCWRNAAEKSCAAATVEGNRLQQQKKDSGLHDSISF